MMQIAIEISKRVYHYILKTNNIVNSDRLEVAEAIVNGTLLPKGHGKIIDVNEIVYETECRYMSDGCCTTNRVPNIYATPAIIEADTAERSDKE